MRGHVRQRGKSWNVVVDTGRDETGRRRQKWHAGYRTKHDAEIALTQILGRLQTGSYVEPTKQTVATFLREWLEATRVTVRPSTLASYRLLVESYLIPQVGAVKLQALTASQLNAAYATLLATGRRDGKGGLSPRSVRYAHTVLRKALKEAMRWDRVPRNVADQADPPRVRASSEMRTWSATELRAFLEHVAADDLYAAWLLSASTGMRRGEVLGLRWRDADLDAGRVAVVQTLVAVRYAVSFSTPKTAKGRRSVALDPMTVAALRAHRTRQLEQRLSHGAGYQDNDLAFCRADGSPLHPDNFSQAFEGHAKRAGLPRIRLHDLRHTHATLALGAGIHPKVVSERLGHATVSITLDTYSHAIPAMQEEAAARIAAVVFGG